MRRKPLHLFVPFVFALILLVAFILASGSAHAWLGEAIDPPGAMGDAAPSISLDNSVKDVSQTVNMVFPIPGGSPSDVEFYRQAARDLADLMTLSTGLDVQVSTVYCAGVAVDALASGAADVGFLSAPTYVLANDLSGVEVQLATVRFGQSWYRGQFLARSDSGINSLADLENKNFAFPTKESSSGFLYPAAHISNTFGMSYEAFFSQTLFTGSHDDVVRAVYYGAWEGTPIHGGAAYEDVRSSPFLDDLQDVMDVVEVLTYTQSIPNDTVSTRVGLDPALTDQVMNGLFDVSQTPLGATVIMNLLGAEGFEAVEDSTYDPVRDMVKFFGTEIDTCGSIYLPVVTR